LLASRGRDVVVLEKERHPRFHIGESLLPLNLPLFERLGVAEEIDRIAMPKYGAEFVSPWHACPVTFEFSEAWDKAFPLAYQVRRSQFDEILFRNATRKGARTLEGCRAISVEPRADGATVTSRSDAGAEQRWQTRFLVDASGRETFLAGRLGMKRRSRKHNSAAIFAHFTGAARLSGKAEGNITVFWFDHGWLWFIPLSDNVTSVGAVCWPYYMKSRQTELERFLFDTIAMCPSLAARLRNARLTSPVTATGNYSYCAERSTGDNYLLLGDAFTFIDPVFSTGVYLAMHSAFVGADTIEHCLDRPAKARAALKAFDASVRRGPRIFSWFIYRATTPSLRDLFMDPSDRFRMKEAVLALLAGDVYRGMPFRWRLRLFRLIYYMHNAMQPRRTWRAWLQRRQWIRPA